MMGAGAFVGLALAALCASTPAQPPPMCGPSVTLEVKEGRPLRVALDRRVRVRRRGQAVTAIVVEPVYAHDRIVIAAGTRVAGHVETLAPVTLPARLLGMLRLDFSPPRRVGLTFDRLLPADGREIALATRVGPGIAGIVLQTAAEPRRKGAVSRAREEVARRARSPVEAVRGRGRMRRLRDALLAMLPFHAQYLQEGTVYDAHLLSPLHFGWATEVPRAPAGSSPPAEAVLDARLITAVDSTHSARGTPIQAVLTRPVFSRSQRLVFPEGTMLSGEVTFARPARKLRRNGQLRVLFDTVHPPDQPEDTMMASLHGAEVARGARLAIDDEGGARVTNPGTRFVAPALAVGALGAATLMEPVTEPGQVEPGVLPGALEPNSLGASAGGFSGLGLAGAVVSRFSRPGAIGLAAVGLARSVYGSFLGKGREVSFPAGTRIQVQLAPGPSPSAP